VDDSSSHKILRKFFLPATQQWFSVGYQSKGGDIETRILPEMRQRFEHER